MRKARGGTITLEEARELEQLLREQKEKVSEGRILLGQHSLAQPFSSS